MKHQNLEIINKFFEAYSRHDLTEIKQVTGNETKVAKVDIIKEKRNEGLLC